MLHEKDKVTK